MDSREGSLSSKLKVAEDKPEMIVSVSQGFRTPTHNASCFCDFKISANPIKVAKTQNDLALV